LIRYPYKIFYRINGGAVEILHVHHAVRRPPWGLEREIASTFQGHAFSHKIPPKNTAIRSTWGENIALMKPALASWFALAVLGGSAQAQQAVKIRGSWVAPVANWASILLEKKDLARHLGKSYVFEPVRYAGTPPMVTALANNELEISNLAYSTLAIAIQNAGMDDLRVIADEFRDGVEGWDSQE